MSRVVLKERQFEPTGISLGEFSAVDLEPFDLQYKDSDGSEGQDGASSSGDKKSNVPDPIDDNPLENQEESNAPEDISDIPDEWDPYGDNLDDKDFDMPDETPKSEDDGESPGGGGSGPQSGGGSMSSDDDIDIPDQTPNQGNQQSDSSDSDGSSSGDQQGSQQGSTDQNSSSKGGDSGEEGEESDEKGSGDFDDLMKDYEIEPNQNGQGDGSSDVEDDKLDGPKDSNDLGKNDSNQGTGNGGPRGNSTDDGSETGDADLGGSSGGGGSSGASGNSGNANGQGSSNLDLDRSQIPSDEELEADDTDFDPDLGSLSELEEALKDIDQKSADSIKERRESENTRSEQEEEMSRNSQRDREDEIAAARDIVGKAAKDTQSDDIMNGNQTSDDDDSNRYNRDKSESQDDILKELGAGNLTTLFNPGNLQDWRSRLDRIFDKALGFDIITNPNLVNKKIEDAPPGREDETPQIKNIAILLDMSGSMGAREFKQVISHIDTMLQARKLTKVWFHIVGFGTSNINDIPPYYAKVKGAKFKQTMMTKFKNDAGWMTDILPGIVFCSMKVHKPDAIIIMTDAEFNGSLSQFERDSKAKTFMKKNKNKIIWALTANARMQGVKDYDPTAITKKRYIKFKKGGSENNDW